MATPIQRAVLIMVAFDIVGYLFTNGGPLHIAHASHLGGLLY